MNRSSCLDDHFSGIRVTPNLKRPTRRLRPGQSLRRAPTSAARVFLFGLAPGDAYRASDVTTPAVGSYPAVSPLPKPSRQDEILSPWPSAVYFLWCRCRIAPPGNYPAPRPWSPDFPPGTQGAERSPSLLTRANSVYVTASVPDKERRTQRSAGPSELIRRGQSIRSLFPTGDQLLRQVVILF